ncbi:MAG: uracil-DNA glycosylase [Candidatus Omnitrophota bacterium]
MKRTPARILKKITAHPLFDENKQIVVGRGNSHKPEFLILGEAPGKQENRQGLPFVGRAGRVLDKWLGAAGVDDFYISNVIPLMPVDERGKIRGPRKNELEYFIFFADWVIREADPRCILTLGDSATWALAKMRTRDLMGRVSRRDGKPLTGIFHPARYIRSNQQDSAGLRDFTQAVHLLREQGGLQI